MPFFTSGYWASEVLSKVLEPDWIGEEAFSKDRDARKDKSNAKEKTDCLMRSLFYHFCVRDVQAQIRERPFL